MEQAGCLWAATMSNQDVYSTIPQNLIPSRDRVGSHWFRRRANAIAPLPIGRGSLSLAEWPRFAGQSGRFAFCFPNQGLKPLATLFDPYGVAFVIEIFSHLLSVAAPYRRRSGPALRDRAEGCFLFPKPGVEIPLSGTTLFDPEGGCTTQAEKA
jgi:hypothetical protein